MINDIQDSCKQNMEKSMEHMRHSFKSLRTGRVLVSVLDSVKIDYYGTLTPLDQVGSVVATDATTIVVNPWEKPLLADIESAISKANIGVNPNNDGDKIMLNFPPMTAEQRQESVKKLKSLGEDAKVSVRNDRKKANDAIKKLEKDKEITADESKSGQDAIQKLTDKYIAEIDTVLKEKEAEILKV